MRHSVSQGSISNTFLHVSLLLGSWTSTESSDKSRWYQCNSCYKASVAYEASLHGGTSATTGTLAPGASQTPTTLQYTPWIHYTPLQSTTLEHSTTVASTKTLHSRRRRTILATTEIQLNGNSSVQNHGTERLIDNRIICGKCLKFLQPKVLHCWSFLSFVGVECEHLLSLEFWPFLFGTISNPGQAERRLALPCNGLALRMVRAEACRH